jgi:hypothetical protein
LASGPILRGILPAREFVPEDANAIRGFDADSNSAARDLYHRNGDAVADDDLLTRLPAED